MQMKTFVLFFQISVESIGVESVGVVDESVRVSPAASCGFCSTLYPVQVVMILIGVKSDWTVTDTVYWSCHAVL